MTMSVKRCADMALSSVALLVLSPVLAIIALAVRVDSGSPILFSQERVGLRFRRFQILKFRTMRVHNAGRLVTVAGDDRITRVGRVLRRTKLDELPQLWNVLRGEMSVVGPRPEVPEYVDLFRERYRAVLTVPPGMTDLASIQFRNEEELLSKSADPIKDYTERVLPAKLELAERYVDKHSICGDIAILFRTGAALVKGRTPPG
jgi:lipopolysaccharide/colanic/teichoic acid biosynthesis glycosyltransferase